MNNEERKLIRIDSKVFDDFMAKYNGEVIVVSREPGPPIKMKVPVGSRRLVYYRDETKDGVVIPDYYADVNLETIFQDREYPSTIIGFKFVQEKDEKDFLEA